LLIHASYFYEYKLTLKFLISWFKFRTFGALLAALCQFYIFLAACYIRAARPTGSLL